MENQKKWKHKKVAVVLGSGAARGLAHIGVLKVLEEWRVPVQIVVGTSMGAMIGGAYAAGLNAAQIENIACETNWLRVAKILFPKRIQRKALVDGEGVEEFLLALVGDRQIEQLERSFACIATDIWSGEEIELNSGSLVRAIRASISFPFLFSPFEINNHLLMDGGMVNPLPVNVAREMGADLVIAVQATRPMEQPAKQLSSGSIVTDTRMPAAVSASSFLERFFNYFDENGLLREKKRKPIKKPTMRQQMVQIGTTMENKILNLRLKESPPDILIRPEVEGIQFFDFNRAREIITAGEQAMRTQEKQLISVDSA